MNDIKFVIEAVDKFSRTFDELDSRQSKAFQVAGTVGKGMMAGGGAVAAGLGLAVKTSADFEKGMSRVGALSGATEGELAMMTDTAKTLGATTAFTAREASDGMSFLAMAGYDANDTVSAMPGLLSMAAAGQTDLATTADIASNVLQGFGMEAGETAKVADVLTGAFTSSNVDLGMLGETMKYVAPIANATGFSLEEMAAATGMLGNAGIQGSMAGTGLRQMLTQLAAPTAAGEKLMSKLGISMVDSAGNMKPLHEIVGLVTEATDGMGEAQKLNAVKTLVGQRAASGFLALMDAGQDDIIAFTEELENSGGIAEQIADQQLDNLAGQLTILKSGFEGMAIALGDALLPYVKVLVEWVQQLVTWFNNLDPSTQRIIAVLAALSSIAMIVGGALLLMVSFLPHIMAGFSAVAAIFGLTTGALSLVAIKIVAVIAVLALIAAAVIYAYNNFEWFRNGVHAVWNFIVTAITAAINIVRTVIQTGLDFVRNLWATHGETVMTILQNIWTTIQTAFTNVANFLRTALQAALTFVTNLWNNHGTTVMAAVQRVWQIVSTTFTNVANFLRTVIVGALEYVRGLWATHGETVMTIINNLWTTIQNVFTIVSNFLRNIFTGALEYVRGLWETHRDTIMGVVDTVREAIMTGLTAVYNFIMEIWSQISAFWNDHGQQILQATINVFTGIYNFLHFIGTQIQNFLKLVWVVVVAAAKAAWAVYKAVIGTALKVIWTIIKTVFTMIVGFLRTAWTVVTTIIRAAMPIITGIIKVGWWLVLTIIQSVWSAIKSVIQGAVNIVLGIIRFFAALFTGDLRGMWEAVKQIFIGAVQFIWGIIQLWFIGKILKVGMALFKGMTAIFRAGWSAVRGVTSRVLSALRGIVTRVFTGVRNIISRVLTAARNIVTRVLTNIRSRFMTIFNAVRNIVTRVFTAIRTRVTTVMSAIRTRIANILTAIRTRFVTIWNAIRSRVTNAVNTVRTRITNAMNRIRTTVTNVLNRVRTTFTNIWNRVRTIVTNAINRVRTVITNGMNRARTIVSNVMNRVRTIFSNIWSRIKTIVANAISRVRTAISNGMNRARTIVSNIMSRIRTIFSNIWSRIRTIITNAMTRIRNAIRNGMNRARTTIISIFNRIMTWVRGLPAKFFTMGKDIISGLIGGIKSMAGSALTAIKDLGKSVIDKAKGVFQIFSPSRVMHGIGRNVGLGVVNGIKSMIGSARTAASNLSSAVTSRIKGVVGGVKTRVKSTISKADKAKKKYFGLIKGKSAARGDYLNDYIMHVPKAARASVLRQGAKMAKKMGYFGKFGNKHLKSMGAKPLATGGITTGETLALIGEGKENEAVLPLSKLQNLIDFAQNQQPNVMAPPRSQKTVVIEREPAEPQEVTYHFEIPVVIDGREVARATAVFTQEELDRIAVRKDRNRGY
jgi:TP901 family phage tail tape measure protein